MSTYDGPTLTGLARGGLLGSLPWPPWRWVGLQGREELRMWASLSGSGVRQGLAERGDGGWVSVGCSSRVAMAVSTSASSSTCSEFVRCWPQENFRSFIRSFSEMARPASSGISSSVSACEPPPPRPCPSPSPRSLLESQDRNSSSDGLRSPSRFSSVSLESESRASVSAATAATAGSLSSSCSWSIRQRRNSWVSCWA